ncbi:MAG: hypothetical protein H6835_11405 [Planctomycetes bacterium]|nr:hypothetical protein [Planctomycetota bacterium]
MDLSVGSLFTMLVVSSIGLGLYLYGKKQARAPQLVAGVVMMGFPYFVTGALWMSGIAVGVLVAVWFACRAGL